MAVKIRLKRGGKKKQPIYRIVAIEHTNPRDGKEIEVIGQYNPRDEVTEKRVNIKIERFNYWLSVGAKPTKIVDKLIKNISSVSTTAVELEEKKVAVKSKNKETKKSSEKNKE